MNAKQNLEMIGMTPLSSIAMSAYTDLVRLLKDDALSGVEGKPEIRIAALRFHPRGGFFSFRAYNVFLTL